MKKQIVKILFFGAFLCISINAQTETLNNRTIVEMSKIGLDKEIILKKINDSPNNFDISANALIDLKKEGIDNAVINLMLEKVGQKSSATTSALPTDNNSQGFSDSRTVNLYNQTSTPPTPKDALLNARTIALEKSSINPSRQALEKELLKRKEWKQFNLSIVRYKEAADLYMEIGFVHFSVITHRYVWRVYDRRSGIVVAAGETTSWGSLAENIARDAAKKLGALATK
jgi:hypothetical protein